MAGKKYLQRYGAQQGAMLLNGVSKMLMKSPKLIQMSQQNPQAFSAMVSGIAEKLSSSGGISKAAEFDPTQPVDDQQAKQSFLDGN